MLPEFNDDGALPEGVHQATESEVLDRFAGGSARRKWLADRLQELLSTARATGQLSRVFLWGSFVTDKESPNDLDVLIVMTNEFDLANVRLTSGPYSNMQGQRSNTAPTCFGRRHQSASRHFNSGWTLTKLGETSLAAALWRYSYD